LVDIDRGLVEQVLDADIVLVSPLRRAMATAIIFLAKAKQLIRDKEGEEFHRGAYSYETRGTVIGDDYFAHDFGEDHLPEIRIHADLREKYGSESDKPGADGKEDAMEYVRRIAEACGERWFVDKNALDKTYQQIQKSYHAEQARTQGWSPDPTDGFQFAEQIRRFKEYLTGIVPKKVFIVGHNAWSRFAFSSFMPAAGTEDTERNIRFGSRKVLPLRNVGLIQAQFQNGVFSKVKINPEDLSGSGKWAVLVCEREATAQGVVPAGIQFNQILIWKEKMIRPPNKLQVWSPYRRLIVTLAVNASGNGAKTFSWTDKWGAIDNAAKDSYEIRNLSVRQTKTEPLTFNLQITGVQGGKDVSKNWNFAVKDSSLHGSHGLPELLHKYAGDLEVLSL